DVGQGAQIRNIVRALVRLAVVADEAGTIDAKRYGQRLHADVVNDLVVGSLKKCGIYGDERTHARRGRTGREAGRVRFGDADVEAASRKGFCELFEAGTIGHG